MTTNFDTLSDDALIQQWQSAKEQMAALKELENDLRNAVLNRRFANKPNGYEGTVNQDLGRGWKLKAVFKNTLSVKDVDSLHGVLDRMENESPEGKLLAERLVKWKPSVSVSEYKQLDEKYRQLIDTVIEIKPSQATLELVAPKVAK